MINLRTPGDGPLWLPAFAASIVAAFKSIMAAPFRLWNVATAGLPPAADWKQGLIYDSSTGTIRYSDGTSWIELKNAALFVLKAGDTMTGPLVISKAGADGDFDLVDTNATSAGGGGRIRIRSTKPTAAGHRIGVAHFAAIDSSAVVQNAAAIEAFAEENWGTLAGEGTYLSVGVTAPGAFARVAALLIQSIGTTVLGWIKPSSYTVAGAPSASASGAGAMIYVSNEIGGAVPAFSDGTNWRRVTDRAVIS
jgi:hypothetical protein